MIALSQHCLPRDPEKINQCFAIFTDLDSSDVSNKDLYIACQIIRIGTHTHTHTHHSILVFDQPTLSLPLPYLGHDLETKKTAMPLRKPHGAAVYPLHKLLCSKLHDEKDAQMEVFVYVLYNNPLSSSYPMCVFLSLTGVHLQTITSYWTPSSRDRESSIQLTRGPVFLSLYGPVGEHWESKGRESTVVSEVYCRMSKTRLS